MALGIMFSQSFLLLILGFIHHKYLLLRFSKEILIRMLNFGLPFVPSALLIWIMTGSDRIMLARFSSTGEVALYSIAFNIAAVMSILVAAFGQAYSPYILEQWRNNQSKAKMEMADITNYLLLGLFIFSIFLLLISKDVMMLLFPMAYWEGWVLVYPLALGVILQATTQVTATGISLKQKTKYIMYSTFFSAMFNVVYDYVVLCFIKCFVLFV
jgi:O-antigen/teichoic acid export membrane protein